VRGMEESMGFEPPEGPPPERHRWDGTMVLSLRLQASAKTLKEHHARMDETAERLLDAGLEP